MTCGKLEVIDGGYIRGYYKVWGKPKLEFNFVRNASKGDKAPDFIIQAKDSCGDVVDIGHAYENKIKKGEKMGMFCYSVHFVQPGLFKEPVKLAAFPAQADGKVFSLEYSTEKESDVERGQIQAVA